jgi:hypothetical protein
MMNFLKSSEFIATEGEEMLRNLLRFAICLTREEGARERREKFLKHKQ